MFASWFDVVVPVAVAPAVTTATRGELCTTCNIPLLRHTDNHFADVRPSRVPVNHRSHGPPARTSSTFRGHATSPGRGPRTSRLRDPGHPRRPGTGPGDRRRGRADLPDVSVRPGRCRTGPGMVLLPHRESDPL